MRRLPELNRRPLAFQPTLYDVVKLSIRPKTFVAERTGVEPASDKSAIVFRTTALTDWAPLPRENGEKCEAKTFALCSLLKIKKLAGALRFERKTSILETDVLPIETARLSNKLG